jgi:hypothetical protein
MLLDSAQLADPFLLRSGRRNCVVNETATTLLLTALANYQDTDLGHLAVAAFDRKPFVLKIAR